MSARRKSTALVKQGPVALEAIPVDAPVMRMLASIQESVQLLAHATARLLVEREAREAEVDRLASSPKAIKAALVRATIAGTDFDVIAGALSDPKGSDLKARENDVDDNPELRRTARRISGGAPGLTKQQARLINELHEKGLPLPAELQAAIDAIDRAKEQRRKTKGGV